MATVLSLITSGNAATKAGYPCAIRFGEPLFLCTKHYVELQPVPHDQWLLTHIGSYWKVKDVINHTLARCLALNFLPPDPPSFSSPSESQPRSPSPITFAPDPADRPESPLLFAVMKPKSPHSEDEDSEEEDDFSMNLDVRGKTPKMTYDDQGRAVVGLRMAPSPSKSTSVSGSVPSLPTHRYQAKSDASSIYNVDPKAVPEIAHLSFTLIRFSTGQILEDDLTISDYDIKPHELLELHLSISPPSPDHVTATSFLPPTPSFPFPLLAAPPQLLQAKSKKKRAQIEALVAPHVTRLVSLPRAVPHAYAAPYWEGWIRILRLASRDDEEYLFHGLPAGATRAKPKSGTPGYAQYGFGPALGDWQGHSTASVTSEGKDIDSQLAKNFGMSGSPPSPDHQIRTAKSKFEWRERWLIIREGWLFLLKERGVGLPLIFSDTGLTNALGREPQSCVPSRQPRQPTRC